LSFFPAIENGSFLFGIRHSSRSTTETGNSSNKCVHEAVIDFQSLQRHSVSLARFASSNQKAGHCHWMERKAGKEMQEGKRKRTNQL
jgi:hypothetical protein